MDQKMIMGIAIAVVVVAASFGGGFLIGNKTSDSGDDGAYATITTYTSGDGYVTQNFTKVPERIACGCSTFLNIIFYFGLEDKVVGLFYDEEEVKAEYKDRYDALVMRIGSDNVYEGNIDSATCTNWEPDLIVGWASGFKEGKLGTAGYWNKIGCNVWALESMNGAMDINSMVQDYMDLGKIFKIEKKTNDFINLFIEKLGNVKGALKESTVKLALYDSLCQTTFEKGLWMYGNDTFVGKILKYVGADNVFPDGGRVQLASVIDKADQIQLLFLICYGDCTHDANYTAWTKTPELAAAPAVVNGNVKDMGLSLAYGGDPAVLDFLDDIYNIIKA